MSEVKNVPELRFPEFDGDWANKPLSKVCKMKAGKFVQASDISEKQGFDMFPCFGGNGLRGYTRTKTHEGVYPLIGRQGALCGNVQLANGQFHATEHAVVVDANDQNDSVWLYYQLDKLNLNRYATGQAQPGLSVDVIDKVKAYFPTKEEQQKIADFLSSVDKKIELLTEKHRLLTEYKKGVMQQIFSQQIGFKDDQGNYYPKWEEKKLGDTLEFIRSGLSLNQVNEKTEYPVSRIETISHGKINLTKVGYVFPEKDISSYKLITGDILFSNINSVAHIGKVAIVEDEVELFHGMNLLRLRANAALILPKFLYMYLIRKETKQYFERICNQAVNQASINQTDLKKTIITIPAIEEQQQIARFLTEIDHKIDQAWSVLQQTKTFKKGLLQKMFV